MESGAVASENEQPKEVEQHLQEENRSREPLIQDVPNAEKPPVAIIADEGFHAPAPRAAPYRAREGNHDPSAARAVAAAVAAAAMAAPAQKERVIEQIAVQMMSERSLNGDGKADSSATTTSVAAVSDGPQRSVATYTPPLWAGVPTSIPYSVEVMKTGSIVDQRDIHNQDHYTFGRAPTNDFVLEHPSCSRLHAVLQYREKDGAAFVYDMDSVHGTFINKARLKGKQYVRVNVGDQLRFGQSTRIFLIGGPTDLMPPEDDTPLQKKQKAAVAVQVARREREAAIAEAQMAAALRGGVTWGMGEDAQEDIEEGGEIDWRAYAQTHTLNEKQQKLAAKIQKKTNRCQQLRKEVDRIRAKESKMEELTSGQLSTLVRNEQEIDKAMEEMEELEEMLVDSIRDAIGARKQAKEKHQKKKRRKNDSDDDEVSSDDDAFYDRTGQVHKKRRAGTAVPAAEDAASLIAKIEALKEQRNKLMAELAHEETLVGCHAQQQAVESDGVDALDAFMGTMEVQLEQDKVGDLKKSISHIEEDMQQVEALVKIADPEGYFRPGTVAAEAASRRAAKQREIEAAREAAEEKQRKAREAAKLAEREIIMPEVEEEPGEEEGARVAKTGDTSAAVTASGGDMAVVAAADVVTAGTAASTAAAQREAPEDVNVLAGSSGEPGGLLVPPKTKDAGVKLNQSAAVDVAPMPPGTQSAHLPLRQTKNRPMRPPEPLPYKAVNTDEVQAKVTAELALLAGRRHADEADESSAAGTQDDDADVDWKPPEGQTGDGRTRLNDLFGY